ncbi:MAG: hypothetical protein IKR87_01695, partial [Candidatus Methanomethylophilaceae archaeon]|nr:hypothetical protein [Candidatus Methanomethylophilaceae archaeon]
EGEAEGEAREREKARLRMIEAYALSVRRVIEEMGATLDSAMRIVPQDIEDDVRARVVAQMRSGGCEYESRRGVRGALDEHRKGRRRGRRRGKREGEGSAQDDRGVRALRPQGHGRHGRHLRCRY